MFLSDSSIMSLYLHAIFSLPHCISSGAYRCTNKQFFSSSKIITQERKKVRERERTIVVIMNKRILHYQIVCQSRRTCVELLCFI